MSARTLYYSFRTDDTHRSPQFQRLQETVQQDISASLGDIFTRVSAVVATSLRQVANYVEQSIHSRTMRRAGPPPHHLLGAGTIELEVTRTMLLEDLP